MSKHTEVVLARLRRGTLTDNQARDELGVNRLAAVVHKLRARHEIRTHYIKVKTRYDKSTFIAQYEYVREKEWSSSASTPASVGPSVQ